MQHPMTYRSICTGIAAETVAWHPLGWKALSFAEIDPFCCTLLKHRYPEVPNHGDFTKIQAQADRADILMGGTPCQSFSVAGKRAGLDDPRGNLALEFARLAERLRPRWIVWENVQGVLSQAEGRAFGTFLWALEECGYGFAYRVLDAQFDGLAQRRGRVFVVGYLGDWRPPAAVLFERESLRRDTAPGRKAGQEVAGVAASCVRGSGPGRNRVIAHTLRADGFDASEDGSGSGSGRGSPLVVETLRSHPRPGSNTVGAIAFDSKQSGADAGELAPTLRAMPHDKSHANGGGGIAVMSLTERRREGGRNLETQDELAYALRNPGEGGGGNSLATIATASAVRRLTPMEWERLMGLEDNYTLIPYPRLKLAADGPRYKAIGNSIAVPTLRWIGKRIQTVDEFRRLVLPCSTRYQDRSEANKHGPKAHF